MAYGTVKVDNITFTNGGVDQTITVSGIVQSISGDITATGTIQAATIVGTSTVSGTTVTGNAGVFTTLTGGTAGFTTVTGTTVTGSTANFVSGVFSAQVSGATITGNLAQFTTLTGNTAGFTTVTGTTVTGTTANFATISGTTITGGVVTVASGIYTGNVTAAAFIPTGSTVPTNGLYLPSANSVALSTNGTERLLIDSAGRVGIGAAPSFRFDVTGTGGTIGRLSSSTSGSGARAALWLATPANGSWTIDTGFAYSSALVFTDQNVGERVRIDSSGRVGIGTSAPSTTLHCATNNSSTSVGTSTLTAILQNSNATSGAINGLGFANSGGFYSAAIYTTQAQTGNSGDNLVLNTKTSGGAWNTGVVIDTAGRVGIGTTSPAALLDVQGSAYIGKTDSTYGTRIIAGSGSYAQQEFYNGATRQLFIHSRGDISYSRIVSDNWLLDLATAAAQPILFTTNGNERARIDSSGRLLVGTSSARSTLSFASVAPSIQVAGNTTSSSSLLLHKFGADANACKLILLKNRGVNADSNGGLSVDDPLGVISFEATDGFGGSTLIGAEIGAYAEAGHGSANDDGPTRLVFSTTADGAASPTERMRITSAGLVGVGTSSPAAIFSSKPSASSTTAATTFTGDGLFIDCANTTDGIGNYGGAISWSRSASSTTRAAAITNVQTGSDSDVQGLAFLTHASATSTAPLIEAMRITGAGLVGIGVTDPGSYNSAASNLVIGSTTANSGLTIRSGATGVADRVGSIYFADGTTGNEAYRGYIDYAHSIDTLAIGTSGLPRLVIDSSGRLLVGTSSARSNFFNATVATQFQLEGTTGANSSLSVTRNSADADASNIILGKTRSASVGGNTIVNSGDQIGQIGFHGSDGTELVVAATIRGEVDGTPGADDMPGRLVFSTTADGAASPTERLRITSAGLVGIGTSSPDSALNVRSTASATNPAVRIASSGSLANNIIFRCQINGLTNGMSMTQDASSNVLYTFEGGRVGIGTTTVNRQLVLNDNTLACLALQNSTTGNATGDGFQIQLSGTDAYIWNYETAPIAFGTNNQERFRCDSSGRLLVGTSTARSNLPFAFGNSAARLQVEGAGEGQGAFAVIQNYDSATTGVPAVFNLARSGATSIGSNTIVASGNRLGEIQFSGSDGTNFIQAAVIRGEVDGTPGANDMPGRLVFSTTADGAASPTERLRIDSSGRVGIGTTSPSALLTAGAAYGGTPNIQTVAVIQSATNTYVTVGAGSSSQGGILFADTAANNAGGMLYSHSTDSLEFLAGGNEAARIDSLRRLLVGTSTSTGQGVRLQVEGTDFGGSGAQIRRNSADGSAPSLAFQKSRGTTNASVTSVQDADRLMQILAFGADGTTNLQAAEIAAFVDGTPGANDMPGRLVFSTTADGAASPTERLRITSTGQLRLAGAGITFNGDTATANELDDYEEGTWTPTIAGQTTTGTGTYSVQSGRYTKVGRSVYVAGTVAWSAHDGTGNMRIAGLPFTALNVTELANAVSFTYVSDITIPANSIPIGGVFPNSTVVTLYSMAVAGGTPNGLGMDGSGTIYFSLTYQTA